MAILIDGVETSAIRLATNPSTKTCTVMKAMLSAPSLHRKQLETAALNGVQILLLTNNLFTFKRILYEVRTHLFM